MQSNDTRYQAQPQEASRGHLSIVNRARGLIGQRPLAISAGYTEADVAADSEHYQSRYAWARERAAEFGSGALSPDPGWGWDKLLETTGASGRRISVGGWVGFRWFLTHGDCPPIGEDATTPGLAALRFYLDAAGDFIDLSPGTVGIDTSDSMCRVERVAGHWWFADALDIMRSREGRVQLVHVDCHAFPFLKGTSTILAGRLPPRLSEEGET